jgi:hypothetical protein
MTKEERILKQQYAAQKETEDNSFKQRARTNALQTSQYLNKSNSTDEVLKDADKLYQWLIKVLK